MARRYPFILLLLCHGLLSTPALYLNCSVTTFAGSAAVGYVDGPFPRFNNPVKLAAVPPHMQARLGVVVVADRLNGRLRGVASNGTAWTVPIMGALPAPATPSFAVPHAPTGTLLINEGATASGRLFQVAANGALSLAANFSGDLRDVLVASPGLLFAVDYAAHRVLQLRSADGSGAPGTWSAPAAFSGSGAAGSADGPAAIAQFNGPVALALIGGTLFVAEWSGHRVRAVDAASGAAALFAGSPSGAAGYRDGIGAAARFNTPYAMCGDGRDSLYLVEYDGARMRRVLVASGAVDTLAGTGLQLSPFVNGPGVAATVTNPRGIALTDDGRLLFTDEQALRAVACGGEVGLASATPSPTPSAGASPTGTASPAPTASRSPSPTASPPPPPCVVTTVAGTGVAGAAVDGPAPAAVFGSDTFLALPLGGAAAAAALYIVDTANHRLRALSLGAVQGVAGTGAVGSANGVGGAASFNLPQGLCWDGSAAFAPLGSLIVPDAFNHVVRRVTTLGGGPATGTVALLAGAVGVAAWADGVGGGARFWYPQGCAVDASSGTIFVADVFNHRVRAVSPSGAVSTFAGDGFGAGGSGRLVDGLGTAASFNQPRGITFSAATGILYVADANTGFGNRIRFVTPYGAVGTLAGSGLATGFGDGVGLSASFNYPFGLAVDFADNVYVADAFNFRIRMVTPAGVVTTLAGSGAAAAVDGAGTAASFRNPRSVAFNGSSGDLLVGDGPSLRRVSCPAPSASSSPSQGASPSPTPATTPSQTPSFTPTPPPPSSTASATPAGLPGAGGCAVGVLAGAFGAPGLLNGATGGAARLNGPRGGALILGGASLLVADTGSHALRAVALGDGAGAVVTLAGSGVAGWANGFGAAAMFSAPWGVAVAPGGGALAYVADSALGYVRAVSVATGEVSTLAGCGAAASADGRGALACFNTPAGLEVSPDGSVVFVAERGGNRVRAVVVATGDVTTLAGSGAPALVNGAGAAAAFSWPTGIAFLPGLGALLVGDSGNVALRSVAPSGLVATVAGLPWPQWVDGGAPGGAGFLTPGGVASDPIFGGVYIADTGAHAIRYFAPAPNGGGWVSTVAGSGGSAGAADGGPSTARFNAPAGVAVDPNNGRLFVLDTGNHVVRVVNCSAPPAASASASPGAALPSPSGSPTPAPPSASASPIPGAGAGCVLTTLLGAPGVPGAANGAGASARLGGAQLELALLPPAATSLPLLLFVADRVRFPSVCAPACAPTPPPPHTTPPHTNTPSQPPIFCRPTIRSAWRATPPRACGA
jgi:hypothetical protein